MNLGPKIQEKSFANYKNRSIEFLENRLGKKYADGADGPIVHFSRFFWPQKCVMRS